MKRRIYLDEYKFMVDVGSTVLVMVLLSFTTSSSQVSQDNIECLFYALFRRIIGWYDRAGQTDIGVDCGLAVCEHLERWNIKWCMDCGLMWKKNVCYAYIAIFRLCAWVVGCGRWFTTKWRRGEVAELCGALDIAHSHWHSCNGNKTQFGVKGRPSNL